MPPNFDLFVMAPGATLYDMSGKKKMNTTMNININKDENLRSSSTNMSRHEYLKLTISGKIYQDKEY